MDPAHALSVKSLKFEKKKKKEQCIFETYCQGTKKNKPAPGSVHVSVLLLKLKVNLPTVLGSAKCAVQEGKKQ